MLNQTRIKELFALFTDLPDDKLSKWGYLCDNAMGLLLSKLRDNVNIQANMERLCTAAAAFAYSDYLLLLDGGSNSSADEFKVGDISVKNSSSSNSNKLDSDSVRDYFLEQISDLVRPSTFAFITVPSGDDDDER